MILRHVLPGFSDCSIVLSNLLAVAGTKWITHPGSFSLLLLCISLLVPCPAPMGSLQNMLLKHIFEAVLSGDPRPGQPLVGPSSAYTIRSRVAGYRLWVQLHCQALERFSTEWWENGDVRHLLSTFDLQVSWIKPTLGTSLASQWLRLHLPVQGVQVGSLVGELRSHMPHGQKTKTQKSEVIL